MSKIKKISVVNVKALSSVTLELNGASCIVTGGNDKGKSTLLKALTDKLRGIKPETILKQGEREGFYEMELTTGEKFKWNFDSKKEKLTFITERNIKGSLTKEISGYYFPKVFDIDKFLNEAPALKRKTLQKLVPDTDFEDLDSKIAEAKEEKIWANKKKEESKILFESSPVNPELPVEKKAQDALTIIELSVEQLQIEINGAELHNERIKNFNIALNNKIKDLEKNKLKIEDLKKQIKDLEDADMQLETQIDLGNEALKKPNNAIKTPEVIDGFKNNILSKKNQSKLILENVKAFELRKQYDKSVEDFERKDQSYKQHLANKDEAIKMSKLPAGFGFDAEGVTYNGFQFDKESQSTSALYIGALKLAAIGLGEVKTLTFDASPLDKKNLLEIEKWANENKLQLLIELPDRDGGDIEYQLIQENENTNTEAKMD